MLLQMGESPQQFKDHFNMINIKAEGTYCVWPGLRNYSTKTLSSLDSICSIIAVKIMIGLIGYFGISLLKILHTQAYPTTLAVIL